MLKKPDVVQTKIGSRKSAPKASPAPTDTTKEPESFIVQNIMPSYHCVSDLGLTFAPFEVFDLTYEDSNVIKASKDLRSSMKKGMLKQITQNEWDSISDREIAAERARVAYQQKERRLKMINVDGQSMEAEVLNLNAADAGVVGDEEVSTAGHMNDPMTYAIAFAAATAEWAAKGRVLDASEFSKMVAKNPKLVQQYISEQPSGRGVTSGHSRRGKATVMMPAINEGDSHHAAQMNMSNSSASDPYDTLENGYAEEIDLASDED